MTNRRALRFLVEAVALGALLGCVEPPFSPHLPDNVALDIQNALTGARPSANAQRNTPTAYLVTLGAKHVIAFDLDGNKVRWDVATDVTSRLAVGAGFIAHRQGTRTLVVRAADRGAERCRVELGSDEKLLGIAAAERVYYSSQLGEAATAPRQVTALDANSCVVLWRDQVPGSIGAPAALGGLLAVPYLHQNVVLLDGLTGRELARVRSKDDDIGFVRATAEGLFYGSNKGIYLVSPRSAGGTQKDTPFVEAALRSDKIRRFYSWDGYQLAQVDYTAFDRNRLLWRADASGDAVQFHDGLAYLHNFRFLFGFDAATGDVRWAYAHPKVDLVGSEDTGRTILFASTEGELGALDAKTGAVVWRSNAPARLAGVTFDADGFAPDASHADTPAPLPSTLASIVWDPDARFTAVKVYAVDALSRMPGSEVTEALLQIVLKPGVAPTVAARAAEALVSRKDSSSAARFREALAVHYDYLDDKQPHAVDVLARVSAAIDDKESVPLLGVQLLDGATPQSALKDITQALVTLGGPGAIAPLRNLLLANRCDPQFLRDLPTLELAATGLLTLGGEDGRRVVSFVADDRRTLEPLAQALHRALAPPAKGASSKDSPKRAAPSPVVKD